MKAPDIKLKTKIREKFGTVRRACAVLGISRWRLSSFINGYVALNDDEKQKLQLHALI